MRKFVFGLCAVMGALLSRGEITVSDIQVFSGYPWKEVVIGYTIKGTDAEDDYVRLTATDKSVNKTYTAQTLTGAELTEGRHVLRWNAAADGAKFSSEKVVFSVSIVSMGVQLWANGPCWAEYNVGATQPEESGYYFWWGDTIGYKRNASNDGFVSVANGSSFSFEPSNCPTSGKSNSQLRSMGYIDATGNLVVAHDVAAVHLGAPWRMPTKAEFDALFNNCDQEWTSRNGVSGLLIKGRGAFVSKSIFLPTAGRCGGLNFWYLGSIGSYWSSTPLSDRSDYAWILDISSGSSYITTYSSRYFGLSVRPVRGFAK